MGSVVPQKEKALQTIKSASQSSNSVPSLRAQVAILTDEVQKLKDVLLGKEEVKDD